MGEDVKGVSTWFDSIVDEEYVDLRLKGCVTKNNPIADDLVLHGLSLQADLVGWNTSFLRDLKHGDELVEHAVTILGYHFSDSSQFCSRFDLTQCFFEWSETGALCLSHEGQEIF